MLHVGVDDTDSRDGGCTTALVPALRAAFPELSLQAAPRLVRLNPNVPWKTRGNGAVALTFSGRLDLDQALDRAWEVLARVAARADGTDPGVAVAESPPDASLYDAAVSRIVDRDEAVAALADVKGRHRGGRGVIGAAAALAWPAARTSWELIAYRAPDRIGTPRAIDPALVRRVEEIFPSLFDTYDLVEDDVVCVPSSPCPVLWGLRGDDPDALPAAARHMGPEPAARTTLFLTNQGTDDHLRDATCATARAFESVRVRARVRAAPTEHGGHVRVELEDATGSLRAAAYAPTRSFRATLAALVPGDDVTVCGGVHDGPDGRPTVGVEKLALHEAAPRKAANPRHCGRAMGSRGRGAGWRCATCGARTMEAPTRPPDLALGWHEVPASARRHLARPLGRPS